MAGVHLEAEARGDPGGRAQPLELPGGRGRRARVGVVAGVQLDGGRARVRARPELRLVGVDEQAHADAGPDQALAGAAHPGRVPHDIEATLGGELLAPLRHEARVGGADTEREGDDRVGHRHLEVQLDAEPSAQFLDVALLDMAPVLAQVHGDAVGARRLGHQRRLDGVRVVDPARLPEGGDVVDIDAEMEHGSAQSQVELVPLHEPLQQLAPSLQPPPAGMQHVSCPSRA